MNRNDEVSKLVKQVNNSLFAAKMDNILQYIYEKDLKKEVASIFRSMRDQIITNLKKYYSTEVMLKAHMDLILAPIHESHKEYYDTIMKYKLREYKKGQVQGKRLTTRAKQYAKDYSKAYIKQNGALKADEIKAPTMRSIIHQQDVLFGTDSYSADYMENKTFVASQKTLERVDSDINQIITDGYRDGKGINDVTKRINKRFRQLESWESQRIARTEIHGSHMLGIMQSYEDMGVEYTQWASAHDDRVRGLHPGDKADHVKMDGEIIRMGSTYSNGLKYPGDTSGRIVEWINCRCGNIPWFCPPGYAVPSGMAQFREDDLVPLLDEWQSPEDLIKDTTHSLIEEPFTGSIIDPDDLWIVSDPGKHQGEYLVDLLDGVVKNPKTGKYTFKGLELDYDEELDMAYITHDEILAHNAKVEKMVQFESEKMVIPTDNLIPSHSNLYKGHYMIDSGDGPIIKNPKTGKYEFYGLEVTEYNPKSDFGYVSIKDVEKHNDLVMGKVKPTTSTPLKDNLFVKDSKTGKYKLNVDEDVSEPHGEFIDTDELWVNIQPGSHQGDYVVEWTKITKNPKTGKYEFKGLEVDYDPKESEGYFSESAVIHHNEQFTKQKTPNVSVDDFKSNGKYIYKSELPYDDYLKEYKIAKSDIHYNYDTHQYEYKGMKIDTDDYINSKYMVYVKEEDINKHNDNLITNFMKKQNTDVDTLVDSDVEITWRDINKLELDPYGDYMIDETHRVKFNNETGQWEYKKVPLFDYDEAEHIGIIDADEMKAYMEEHNIQPPNKYFRSKVLTEKEIHGEKFVVDKDGRKWAIDTDRTYEYHQDSLQNANASQHYTLNQRNTVTHWGDYGHQYVSNLIYGNSRYGTWDEYQDLMEEVTPILNRMKQKYKLVVDETLDDEIRDFAMQEYNALKKMYTNIADNVEDFDVTKTLYEIMDLDAAIISTPKLAQDTCFIRYGHFSDDMCKIGEVFDLKGFLSISYDDATMPPSATSHFADKPERWRMVILAPEGTEGIRLNSYFNALTTEREWLLPRNMKFEVLDYGTVIDSGVGKRNTVTIKLIPEDER